MNRTWNGRRRLAMEVLEPRLSLTWTGVPPASINPPTSALAVALNSQNDATGVASITTTEIDYYAFTATANGSYTISATTPASSMDPVIGVYSASGQLLAYNDDYTYPTNLDSRLTVSFTAGARYFLGVTNYTVSSRGSYTWTIDGPTPIAPIGDDAYEQNDSLAAAYNLGTLSATRTVSPLVMADAADWFRFTTTAAGASSNFVSIAFQNSQGNLQLELYDSTGSLIRSSLGTASSESISLNGLAGGTYNVRVYGNAGATNPNYTLSILPPIAVTPPTGGGFQITLNMTGLTTGQQTIFQQAANRWSQVITGDLPTATFRGQTVDDLLINASARTIDGVNGILGQAAPDAFRTGNLLPYHGFMEFDSADMASMERSGQLFGVVMHEIGHILGIGTIWESRGLLRNASTSNPIFVGAQAMAAYNQIFGTTASGVPVENTGGAGTRNSHWRESIFSSELMTGWVGPGTNLPLSRITVGSLADLGYTVNLSAADAFTPSASALSAARQISGSGGASSRLYSLMAASDSTLGPIASTSDGIFANPAFRRVQPMRPRVTYYVRPIDANLADAVMAAATSAATDQPARSLTERDAHDDATTAGHLWETLDSAWNLCPAIA